jgi:hypothetical protein
MDSFDCNILRAASYRRHTLVCRPWRWRDTFPKITLARSESVDKIARDLSIF